MCLLFVWFFGFFFDDGCCLFAGWSRGGADEVVGFLREGDPEDGDREGKKGCVGADGGGEGGEDVEALGNFLICGTGYGYVCILATAIGFGLWMVGECSKSHACIEGKVNEISKSHPTGGTSLSFHHLRMFLWTLIRTSLLFPSKYLD